MNKTFDIQPAVTGTEELFYSYNSQEHRCIGHLRGDFGRNGKEFWTSFNLHKAPKTESFVAEFDDLVNFLREDLFKSRSGMQTYIYHHPTLVLESGSSVTVSGYHVLTDAHEYYIRCTPYRGWYDIYVYCYVREA